MAGPTLKAGHGQALERFLDRIPELPTGFGADAAAADRGHALFTSAKTGCATCHAGSALTNNTTVDVGTGKALQVPSLRGLGWRAPFMHDGCAKTMADRFNGNCGGNAHGTTSTLTCKVCDPPPRKTPRSGLTSPKSRPEATVMCRWDGRMLLVGSTSIQPAPWQ